MSRSLYIPILIIYILLLLPELSYPLELFRGDRSSVSIGGSYKNLTVTGRTLSKEPFTSYLNRFRLDMDISLSDSILVKTIYDNEITLGSILRRGEFLLAKGERDDALFDLSRPLVDDSALYWRHLLYRIYIKYTSSAFNLTLGRQRIAWGQARIWNPTDLFNPVSPLQIEGDQRLGVDAINLEYTLGALSGLNIVYAPRSRNRDTSRGIRLLTNLKGYDLSLMLGEFREDRVLGFDFAGNIGDSGLRGEGVFTDQRDDREFVRLVLSWDYSFPNTLYILFEYLYNGGNLGRGASLTATTTFKGEINTRNRNFIAGHLGYDLTPLIRFNLSTIYDIDGDSIFISPVMTYNILSNIDWEIGLQSFDGDMDSEFGSLPNIYYTSLEWFF